MYGQMATAICGSPGQLKIIYVYYYYSTFVFTVT